jgi:hypothetical protein
MRLWNRTAEADDFLLQAATVAAKAFGMESPTTSALFYELGYFMVEAGRAAEAAQFVRARLTESQLKLPADSPGNAGLFWILGLANLAQGRAAEAEPLLRSYLAFRERSDWAGTWKHSYAQSVLGGALLGQGRLAEAEPLILKSYEDMKARNPAGAIYRPFFRDVLTRVVELYVAWDKPAQAAEWKKKLAAFQQAAKVSDSKSKTP